MSTMQISVTQAQFEDYIYPYLSKAKRGWRTTIKNKITEIRSGKYFEAQLARDLEKADYGGSKWTEILVAISDVVAKGLCDDHWGGFNGGGPLATA